MRARRTALVAALLCLAACASPVPPTRTDRDGAVVLPEGYTEPAVRSPYAPKECPDPGVSLNPARLDRDATGRPTGDSLRRIRDDDKRLVVGVSQTAYSSSRRDLVTGLMFGFEVDLVTRVAEELFGPLPPDDQRLRFVTVPTGDRLYSLVTEENDRARSDSAHPERRAIPEVDMVVADVSVTCARVEKHGIRYSTPYVQTNSGFLVRPDLAEATGPDSFGGHRVCSGSATTNSDEMIEASQRQQRQNQRALLPVSVSDTTDCLVLLQRGLVDAVYSDVLILAGFAKQDPTTKVLDYRDNDGGRAAIAFGDNQDDLVRFVNGVLETMRADGSLQAIFDKWFDPKLGSSPTQRVAYLD